MKIIALLAVLVGLVPVVSAEPTPPYLDPSVPIDKRVDDLISRMTLEEKAQELDHKCRASRDCRSPAGGMEPMPPWHLGQVEGNHSVPSLNCDGRQLGS